MTNLRTDNKRLCLEQEKILRSLSNRQNQQNPHPSAEDREKTLTAQHGGEMKSQPKNMGKMKKGARTMSPTNARQRNKNLYYKDNLKRLNHHFPKEILRRERKLGSLI